MKFRLFRCEKGATAIEFAMLSIPYVFLTVGIIEMSIMFAAASLLEGATNSAARLLRTGQIQQAGAGTDPEAMFRDAFCEYTTALIRCDQVVLTAAPLDSFFDAGDVRIQYDAEGNPISGGFQTAGSDQRMLVRAVYQYHFMTPLIGQLLGGPTSTMTFISTTVLQVEPYKPNADDDDDT